MYPKADNPTRTLAWSIMVSVLFHVALVFTAQELASTRSRPVRGSYPLLAKISPGQRGAEWSAYNEPSQKPETGTISQAPRDNQRQDKTSTLGLTGERSKQGRDEPDEIGNTDDVYLPRELLSTSARPLLEIELQDIQSPVRGSFRMHVWINRYGKVARIDTEAATAPGWLVEQIVERFRQSPFVPATRESLAVPSILDIEVSY